MLKVLIVDDEAPIRFFLRRVIKEKLGQKTYEAKNGLEALKMVAEDPPDLVCLDISMPVMSGIDFLEAIRNDDRFNNLPVVILSGTNEKAAIERILELGVTSYLLKPLSYQITLEKMSTVINDLIAKLMKSNNDDREIEEMKLLLVDKDQYFQKFFKNLFASYFEIISCQDGTECIDLYNEHSPDILFLGENIPVINENLLAKKIRELDKGNKTKIFLCLKKYDKGKEAEAAFDGTLLKSLDPAIFKDEFVSKVMKEDKSIDTLIKFVEGQINNEVLQTLQNVFGKITLLNASDEKNIISQDVASEINLKENSLNVQIKVIFFGAMKDARNIAKRITYKSIGIQSGDKAEITDEQANTEKICDAEKEKLSNIADVVCGRIISHLKSCGFNVKHQDTKTSGELKTKFDTNKWNLYFPCHTEADEKFVFGITLET